MVYMESSNKKERKKEDKKDVVIFITIVALFIIMIGLIFSIKYFYKPKQRYQSYSYNGFTFTNISGLWYVDVQKVGGNIVFSVPLHYSPKEVENVSVSGNVREFLKNKYSYITFDPKEGNLSYVALSASEISMKLAQLFNITPVAACTKNMTNACKNRPIVDCNSRYPVIYIKDEGEAAIIGKNSCITITGEKEKLMMATDKLFLVWLGIMH